MAFWHRKFEAPPEDPTDKMLGDLAVLRKQREDLIVYAGTDA